MYCKGEKYVNEKFGRLSSPKQERIINSALQIFSKYGYENASTNQIVKTANISKGTLFYYFKDKKALYYYLLEYSLRIVKEGYIDKIDNQTSDFIQRMENNSKIKFEYYKNHVLENQFLYKAIYDDFDQIEDSYKQKIRELYDLGFSKINNNQEIKEELFKEDVDAEEAMKIIDLTLKGFYLEVASKLKNNLDKDWNIESLWDDFDRCLTILRKTFYK